MNQKEIPDFYAPDRATWRAWLTENHERCQAVWLVFDKGPQRSLTWSDIVQEALCFGWIDSTAKKVSDTQGKIYVSKRKPKSMWSKINKQHVEDLIAKKLMTPAGLKVIEVSKANGGWDTLTKSDNLELPDELVKLFDQNKNAHQNFEAFSPSSKKLILTWIYSAKTETTKMKRITETVELAAQGIKAYH